MIRKLNAPTAILLVACLTLAPTAMAADGFGSAWFSELIEVVKEWVIGGDDAAAADDQTEDATFQEKVSTEGVCEPGGESGVLIDPSGPGC